MKAQEKLVSITLASIFMILFLIFVSSTTSAATEQNTSSAGTYAYITNYGDSTVSVIDTTNDTVIATVPVEFNPIGVAVTPDGKKVYVTTRGKGPLSGRLDNVSVIDTATNKVTAIVPVERDPRGIAVTQDGKKAYIVSWDSVNITVIDTATDTVIDKLRNVRGFQGIVVTPDGKKVYVTSSGYLYQTSSIVSVIDTTTKVVSTNIYFGEDNSLNHGIAITPDGSKVYVSGSNNLSVIDTETDTVKSNLLVGTATTGVAVIPDGTEVYVSDYSSNTTFAIDTLTDTVTATVPVEAHPRGIAVTPDGKKVYVANYDSNTVSVIDTTTNRVITAVPVGNGPREVAICSGSQSVLPVLLIADFTCSIHEGHAPLIVQFTDLSQNASEWNWDFGDGTTSTEQNPTHTYSAAGAYTVNLTVRNAAGTNSISRSNYINVVYVPPTTNPVFVEYKESFTPKISWTYYDPEGYPQQQYQLEVWTESEGTGTNLWKIQGTGTTTSVNYAGSPLIADKWYFVRVRAFDGYGWSEWSETSFVMTTTQDSEATRKIVIIPAKFSDTVNVAPLEELQIRADSVVEYYNKQSYGKEHISYIIIRNNSSTDGWFVLPNTTSDYDNAKTKYSFWEDALGQAGVEYVLTIIPAIGDNVLKVSVTGYDTALVIYPNEFKKARPGEALCSQGYATAVSSPNTVWAHELGHSLYNLKDKGGDEIGEGNIGIWGLMGCISILDKMFNPASPIIGFDKNKAGWLKYKNISESDILNGNSIFSTSYLDDSKLAEEGLLRLNMKEGSNVKYYIFEARRAKDGVTADPLSEKYYKLFDGQDKGIMVYEVTDNGVSESIHAISNGFWDLLGTKTTLKVGDSIKLEGGTLKVTCYESEGDLKVGLEPTTPISKKIWNSFTKINIPYLAESSATTTDKDLDVNLCIVSSDGERVGVDYTNNIYNMEIDGAETSGNVLGGGYEWISVPESVNATAYITISPDLKTLLESDFSASVDVSSSLEIYDEKGNLEKKEPFSITINGSNLQDKYQIFLPIINSPASITNLQSTNDTTRINWTWTNPTDSDFNHTEIYLNDTFQTNTSAEYFNATDLEPETTYTLSTRTVDNNGNVNETWVNLTATTTKSSIAVEAGSDQTVEEGTNVTFKWNLTTSGSHTYSYHWEFGDGSAEDSSLTTSHTYADDGAYIVNLTATDKQGNFGNDTLLVTVNNAIPVVNVGSDLEATAGDPVSFTGNFSDPGWFDIHTAEWNFGEGTIGAGSVSEENEYPDSTGTVSGSFSYFNAGKYTVTLKVSDDDGGIGQDQLTVTVRPIKAEVTFDPETFNLNSTGDWITAYIELPAGYNVSGIDIGSVLLNGTVPAVSDPKYDFVTNESKYLTDLDLDGIPEKMFKFNRGDTARILKVGDKVTVTFTGKVEYNNGVSSGTASFEGSDVIKVAKKDSKK